MPELIPETLVSLLAVWSDGGETGDFLPGMFKTRNFWYAVN
ncbi:hypothetical protein ACFW1P_27110 [Paenibacillus sp. NPDC058910]